MTDAGSPSSCRSSSCALGLTYLRLFLTARILAALAVTAVIWGWAVAQYPYVLQSHLTISAAAATHSVLVAVLVSMAAGAVLLVPSLVWLYVIFQRAELPAGQDRVAGTRQWQ